MKTEKPYLVTYEGEEYAGWPHEDSWSLFEINGDEIVDLNSGFEIYEEPEIKNRMFFVEFKN